MGRSATHLWMSRSAWALALPGCHQSHEPAPKGPWPPGRGLPCCPIQHSLRPRWSWVSATHSWGSSGPCSLRFLPWSQKLETGQPCLPDKKEGEVPGSPAPRDPTAFSGCLFLALSCLFCGDSHMALTSYHTLSPHRPLL